MCKVLILVIQLRKFLLGCFWIINQPIFSHNFSINFHIFILINSNNSHPIFPHKYLIIFLLITQNGSHQPLHFSPLCLEYFYHVAIDLWLKTCLKTLSMPTTPLVHKSVLDPSNGMKLWQTMPDNMPTNVPKIARWSTLMGLMGKILQEARPTELPYHALTQFKCG